MTFAQTIAGYGRRFAAVHRAGHSVSSPLGAWLVLAMVAQVARDDARAELADVLGLDPDDAGIVLADLLRDPPDAVRTALAAWGHLETRALPSAVASGPIPVKSALDAWAREHTDGLIETFPVDDPAGLEVLLASALASRVSWLEPFGVAPAEKLQSPWSAGLTEVLVDGDADGFLTETADAGLVGVHVARAEGGLDVVSVIAPPEVDRAAVLAAAHTIATTDSAPVPLSRLPLGDRGFLSIDEVTYPGAHDTCVAVLPAWEASSDHDLTAHDLGFGAAAAALASPGAVDARQVAIARYGRYGFEAAAVTAVMVRGAMFEPATARVATLRFGHPYAVVAVVRERRDAWSDVPVFAAWVETPSDVSAVTTGS
jgi:hypothetical protein